MKKQASSRNGLNGKQAFAISAPSALSVQLVGDFTHWNQKPVNLQKGADGVWRTVLDLAPGEHHYRFLVDGQWRDDPECALHVPNPYGSQDAVRQVA
jgi:1,4-alpha-glucan branching enzyme